MIYPVIRDLPERTRKTRRKQGKRPIWKNRAHPELCEWLGGLPAGAVAATATRTAASAATHLGEAIAAIHGLVAARLERHAGLAAAVRAGRCVHLTRGTVAAISAGHRCLARIAALRATCGSVRQPFAGVELLLACREDEVTAAVAASECLIGGQNSNLLSGPAAPLSARTKTAPHM